MRNLFATAATAAVVAGVVLTGAPSATADPDHLTLLTPSGDLSMPAQAGECVTAPQPRFVLEASNETQYAVVLHAGPNCVAPVDELAPQEQREIGALVRSVQFVATETGF